VSTAIAVGELFDEKNAAILVKLNFSVHQLGDEDLHRCTTGLLRDLVDDFLWEGMKQERADLGSIRGQQALFVVNLEPRKIMGETSEGMLFDIGYADGVQPVLAVPESVVPNGTRVG